MLALPMLLLGLVVAPTPSLAHGYLSTPPSRQAQCAKGAISGCGNIIYEPQSVEALKGLRSCNGGIASWAPLADESKAWPVTNLNAGVNTFRWTLTAPHATASYEYYIGNTRVAFIAGGPNGGTTTHSVDLSGYSGRQKILSIWNIGDTANAFYACADVNIGGSGGSTTPTTAPTTRPTTAPTTAPTTRPTTSPTTAPTTAPTSTPVSGSFTWYTVQVGDSLGAIAYARRVTLAALLAINPEITNRDLIYVSQRIRIPARSTSRMNDTEASAGNGGEGFTGSNNEGDVVEEITDNAMDLVSTGIGSHWYAGIQKQLAAQHASGASASVAAPIVLVAVVTMLSVMSLLFGQ